MNNHTLQVGIDVGSTTVKAVVMNGEGQILWKRYSRHITRQASMVHAFMKLIEGEFADHRLRIFTTGSGGRAIAPHLSSRYIQEVNAVTYAVEKLLPDTASVVELGGQDAKVIIWKEDEQGRKSTLTFMNDKCAGGTGASVDKILSKIGVDYKTAASIRALGRPVHPVAAKCGVFAETDVVGLLKSGIDREEIMVSLGAAIVQQNLEVLVRGSILKDKVVLLGGPHTYLPIFTDFWRLYIPQTWRILGWTPQERPIEELIYVPSDSQYFAAIGSVFFGQEQEDLFQEQGRESRGIYYQGLEKLEHYISKGRMIQMMASGAVQDALVQSQEEASRFQEQYGVPEFSPPPLKPGTSVKCFIGIDGGSTSTKVAILDQGGELLYRDYILSAGNPIEDVRAMFGRMERWKNKRDVDLVIGGTGITGYASSILKEAFNIDLPVVETVAHMRAAVEYYGDVDVICDVGGQDIKVLFMKHGRVVDFKLNTQCSAGNGYMLQSIAEQFNFPVEEYAQRAFQARKAPAFNYGCAVFMEQDRVNFQQLGWAKEEIMAGLALVLPKNIWNYVVQEPHIARFGRRIVLQGGTQRNLAAVKAQMDYINERVPQGEVHVHRYADLCGAIGAALEVRDSIKDHQTKFVGIEQAARVAFKIRNNDGTRCSFCKNRCPRSFIDIERTPGKMVRFISGNGCEKGKAQSRDDMLEGERDRKILKKNNPNLVYQASVDVFKKMAFEPLPRAGAKVDLEREFAKLRLVHWSRRGRVDRLWEWRRRGTFHRSSKASMARRQAMVVGIPKLLNMFFYAPFFSTYFRTLGVGKVVFSDYTSSRLWEEGNIWGAIDPCFPAKVAPAHIYNLINKKRPTHICFPIITYLESLVGRNLGNNACVIQMGTPEVVHAVFTKGRDYFKEKGVIYWKPMVRMDRPREVVGELFKYFKDPLEISSEENAWAVLQGYLANERYLLGLQKAGERVLDQLIDESRIGILAIGHPYHHDPGLNHGVLEEFQIRGFPILCIESLPTSEEFLAPLFGGASTPGEGLWEINDVWMRNFNRNTNIKIWAAKVASRHPNLAIIDFSSFKCGHDAPTYSYVDNILNTSKKAHFLFHDIDQNKPKASHEIRIKTIEYFLSMEEQKLSPEGPRR